MKKVLMYSGGWDSYCASFIHPDAKKLYINFHTPYSEIEMKNLPADVEIQDVDLQRYALADGYHIPQRNVIMALIAAASVMPDAERDLDPEIEVYICGVKEDATAPDKSPYYFSCLSLLASMFGTNGNRFNVNVKGFFDYDKITMWEMAGKPDMRNIISCYKGENCGKCLACKRRLLYLDHIYPGEYDIDSKAIIRELEENDWIVNERILARERQNV